MRASEYVFLNVRQNLQQLLCLDSRIASVCAHADPCPSTARKDEEALLQELGSTVRFSGDGRHHPALLMPRAKVPHSKHR